MPRASATRAVGASLLLSVLTACSETVADLDPQVWLGDAGTDSSVNTPEPICGNGITELGEDCDGDVPWNSLCPSGQIGTPSCNDDCSFNYKDCVSNQSCQNAVLGDEPEGFCEILGGAPDLDRCNGFERAYCNSDCRASCGFYLQSCEAVPFFSYQVLCVVGDLAYRVRPAGLNRAFEVRRVGESEWRLLQDDENEMRLARQECPELAFLESCPTPL